MKKRLISLIAAATIVGTLHMGNGVKQVKASDLISGGTISFDMSSVTDLNRFNLYTSFNELPRFYDHTMFSYIYAEQKVILKDTSLSEYLIEADFSPIIKNGHIDMGFYLQASNPQAAQDQINAYQVCIKHDDNKANWDLRLYKFAEGSWQGKKAEAANLPFWKTEWIHVSALVKDGTVTTYLNNDYATPMFSYYIGKEAGLVGIRSFKCPAKMRNLSITSPSFEINTSKLAVAIKQAEAFEEKQYTPKTYGELARVLLSGKAVLQAPKNQLEVNDAVKNIESAIKGLLIKKTFAELLDLIGIAEQITDDGKYTANTIKSLQMCIAEAKKLNESSSVEDISYMHMMLSYRLEQLVEYGVN